MTPSAGAGTRELLCKWRAMLSRPGRSSPRRNCQAGPRKHATLLHQVPCLRDWRNVCLVVALLVGAGAKLNFLDGNDNLFLFRLVRFLLGEILKLAIVYDLANRRVSIRCDLDQIHASFARGPNCIARVHDAEFFTVFSNYAHLWDAYAFVNARGRRATMIGTTAASKTCSYFCTSSVKCFRFQVPVFKLA